MRKNKTETTPKYGTSLYQTADLDVAAYLLATGCKFVKAERPEVNRTTIYLYFEDRDRSEKAQQDYLSGALVPAHAYYQCLEQAKDILFAFKRMQQ